MKLDTQPRVYTIILAVAFFYSLTGILEQLQQLVHVVLHKGHSGIHVSWHLEGIKNKELSVNISHLLYLYICQPLLHVLESFLQLRHFLKQIWKLKVFQTTSLLIIQSIIYAIDFMTAPVLLQLNTIYLKSLSLQMSHRIMRGEGAIKTESQDQI